ncbi:MAG: molybdopterin-dependent oxidoreductase, partial [Rhodospirillaceae bacterium]|nr:molybdopterin-dependent oxidoreductase [Rhodospirillaceae bacterium]
MTTTIEKTVARPSRRRFLVTTAAVGGGLSVGFPLSAGAAGARDAGAEVGAWVFIKPDDTCVIRIARSEMGQGTLTGLAQLVAEELECDWNKVTTEFVHPSHNLSRKRIWGEMSTGGSRGIRVSQDYVRRGGAVARNLLITAAAEQWKVSVDDLVAANGVVTHKASGRKARYGQLAAAAAKLPVPDAKTVKLKVPGEWKVAGKPVKRLDTLQKLDGSLV